MNILVTGATGFVGRRLIPQLRRTFKNAHIYCLVRNLNTDFEKEGRSIIKKYRADIITCDLVTGHGLKKVSTIYPDLIIHLAANTNTADLDHRVNNIGTKNLLQALKSIDTKTHVIHISTMVIVSGRKNTSSPIDERSPDYPTNEYTRTKREGEIFAINESQKRGFFLTVLRPNTIWGSGYRKDSLFDMLNTFIDKRSIAGRIPWPGKSGLIHVDDVVAVIMHFTKHRPKSGKVSKYLLTSENETLPYLIHIMAMKKGVSFTFLPIPKFVWSIAKFGRLFVPNFEKLLPQSLYNSFWRLSIIVDDVVWANTKKLEREMKDWEPKLFKDYVGDVVEKK